MFTNKDSLYEYNYVNTSFVRTGLQYSKRSTKMFVHKIFVFPYLVLLQFLVICDLKNAGNIVKVVSTFEAITSFMHIISRKLTVLLNPKLLEEVVTERNKFWPYDKFGRKLGDTFRWQMRMSIRTEYSLLTITALTEVMISVRPLLVEDSKLPYECWIPFGSEILRFIIYISQMVYFFELLTLVGVFDAVFLFMCVEISIQLRLLQETIKTIRLGDDCTEEREKECHATLKECTEYHLWLLSVYKRLNEVFAWFFLMQYFVTVQGICLEIFLLNYEEIVMSDKIKCYMYMVALSCQLIYVLLPPSFVEIEAEKVTTELYNIDWYNARTNNFKKNVCFILMKSQDPMLLSGKGFFFITRTLGVQIYRLGFSVSTVLRQTND